MKRNTSRSIICLEKLPLAAQQIGKAETVESSDTKSGAREPAHHDPSDTCYLTEIEYPVNLGKKTLKVMKRSHAPHTGGSVL